MPESEHLSPELSSLADWLETLDVDDNSGCPYDWSDAQAIRRLGAQCWLQQEILRELRETVDRLWNLVERLTPGDRKVP